jgi:hypothetical protein
VVLLSAVAAGLLLTILRAKLTGRTLKSIKLKLGWLVFVAVLPQIIVFQIPAIGRQIPNSVIPVVLVLSQAMLLGFAAANIATPGFWVLGLGLLANFTAIVLNSGWMPISPEIVHRILPTLPDDLVLVGQRLGYSKDWIYAYPDIHLPWLSDRFTLPEWIPYRVAFSFGDILVALGTIWLLWSLSDLKNKETK